MKMANNPDIIPDLNFQKNEISQSLTRAILKGDTWYLVDNKWFKKFQRYVGLDDNSDLSLVGKEDPGPVDNEPLLKDPESDEIRDHLIDELDYVLVPQEAWDMLVSWYGLKEGQKPISRKVVEFGVFVKHCKVEVYLLEFKLVKDFNTEEGILRKFSKVDSIGTIENEMREAFNISDEDDVRLWSCFTTNTCDQLVNRDSTVQDEGLFQGQTIIIETKGPDGWIRNVPDQSTRYPEIEPKARETEVKAGPSSTITGMRPLPIRTPTTHSEGRGHPTQPGLCGLCNLGNTCFMNSVIQCMVNTPPIAKYFIDDIYFSELNAQNPLGMKGEIAKAFGDLTKTMWSGKYSYVVPHNFKLQVGRFAPQFSGYQQQDSQELLTFLLDGLHEDLNRIKDKPYVELRDADGRPDHIVANEAWENYQKRNDSIIVDMFHGLLKSTVVCPDCNKVSVTFDPFCYLSTPLPFVRERYIEVFLMPYDPMKKPIQYRVSVPKKGHVHDLCSSLSQMTGISAENMLVVDVYTHHFHKVFTPNEFLKTIEEKDDIFVYELPVKIDDDEHFILPVSLYEISAKKSGIANLFGHPLVVVIRKDNCTYNVVYETILRKMSRYVKVPNDNTVWCDNTNNLSNGETSGSGVMIEKFASLSHKETDVDEGVHDVEAEGEDSAEEDAKFHNSENETLNSNEENQRYLFKMSYVTGSGTTDMSPLQNDGNPIDFPRVSSGEYLAIGWTPMAKRKFYLDQEAEAMEQHESLSSEQLQRINLRECLELFTTVEKLGADNAWYCSTCKKHQCATKKFDLWKLPKILIIHLKRFSYNRYRRDKLDTMVDFPLQGLNLSDLIINRNHPPAVYDLIGVCNHYGGMGGGHYTAFARNKDDNKWYCFDDNSVTKIRDETVVSNAAYVLFYMKREDSSCSPSAVSSSFAHGSHDENLLSEDEMELN